MSYYRIVIVKNGDTKSSQHIDFDNKEDAEHYAKNKSGNDIDTRYEVQKNDHGQFNTIKTYVNGEVTDF